MRRASILAAALQTPDRRTRQAEHRLIATVDDDTADDPAEVEQVWAELEARIARADADPDDAIDRTELRAELLAK